MRNRTPPAPARWLLRLRPLGSRRTEIEADLLELFTLRVESRGVRHARWRYYRDVLSLWTTGADVPIDGPRARTLAL